MSASGVRTACVDEEPEPASTDGRADRPPLGWLCDAAISHCAGGSAAESVVRCVAGALRAAESASSSDRGDAGGRTVAGHASARGVWRGFLRGVVAGEGRGAQLRRVVSEKFLLRGREMQTLCRERGGCAFADVQSGCGGRSAKKRAAHEGAALFVRRSVVFAYLASRKAW